MVALGSKDDSVLHQRLDGPPARQVQVCVKNNTKWSEENGKVN
jgi:hypothetical protein